MTTRVRSSMCYVYVWANVFAYIFSASCRALENVDSEIDETLRDLLREYLYVARNLRDNEETATLSLIRPKKRTNLINNQRYKTGNLFRSGQGQSKGQRSYGKVMVDRKGWGNGGIPTID